MSTDHEAILSVIEQLQRYATHLATCSQDPQVDIAALNRACGGRLAALKQLMSSRATGRCIKDPDASGRDAAEDSQLLDALRALESKTRECILVLAARMEHTERELASYRGTQKAIKAYAAQQ